MAGKKTPRSPRDWKDDGMRVARDMRKMRLAFQRFGIPPKDSENLAFHLAEIKVELREIAGVLQSICRKGKCTRQEYGRLVRRVAVHWPLHLPKARRILERISDSQIVG